MVYRKRFKYTVVQKAEMRYHWQQGDTLHAISI
jgi:hypothetical protein